MNDALRKAQEAVAAMDAAREVCWNKPGGNAAADALDKAEREFMSLAAGYFRARAAQAGEGEAGYSARFASAGGWSRYPIGTRAYSSSGGYWERVQNGWWKWCTGSTFPTPGADAIEVAVPATQPREQAGTGAVAQVVAVADDTPAGGIEIEWAVEWTSLPIGTKLYAAPCAEGVDEAAVRAGCRAFYGERWLGMGEDQQQAAMRWMESAVIAALGATP